MKLFTTFLMPLCLSVIILSGGDKLQVNSRLENNGFDKTQINNSTDFKFDEYGDLSFAKEKKRLDAFAAMLEKNESSQGYIIIYGSCQRDARRRGERTRDYVTRNQSCANRIVLIDGGCRREVTTTLWILPPGAPTPLVDSSQSIPCKRCRRAKK